LKNFIREFYEKMLPERNCRIETQTTGKCEKTGDDFYLRKRGNNKKACKLKSGKIVSSAEITGRNDLAELKITCLKKSII